VREGRTCEWTSYEVEEVVRRGCMEGGREGGKASILAAQQQTHLMEAAEAEGGLVEPRLLQVLLGAGLDVHQGHSGVLVAVVDGEEHVALDAHGLCGLDQRHLALPVDLSGGLLGARSGAVDDRVHADQGGGNGGDVRQVPLRAWWVRG
jgi:hypothetical protein